MNGLNPKKKYHLHSWDKIWICPFCYYRNHFPPHYSSISDDNLPAELFPHYPIVFLWADLLKYFGELGEDCSKEVKEVLTYIERDDILPPIIVLQTLSRNPCLTISVIKDYIARKLEQESKLIEEDRLAIDKYQVSAYFFI